MNKYAVEDKIPMRKSGRAIYYTVICIKCKNEFEMLSYIREKEYTCKKCKYKSMVENRLKNNPDILQKAYTKLNSSIERIIKQKQSIVEYQSAIEKMNKYVNINGWRGSTEEMITALVLFKDNIELKHQYKIGKKKVDFLLPDYKIVLEIDGELYHGVENKKRDEERDKYIINILGNDWDVLRIKTNDINKKAFKVTDAVIRFKKLRNTIFKRVISYT
jgi:very-short-patch-repair endonuclease/DNA-directed RNA polymerase subunit RPC12/RpoP